MLRKSRSSGTKSVSSLSDSSSSFSSGEVVVLLVRRRTLTPDGPEREWIGSSSYFPSSSLEEDDFELRIPPDLASGERVMMCDSLRWLAESNRPSWCRPHV
jgi:hypothetical protein